MACGTRVGVRRERSGVSIHPRRVAPNRYSLAPAFDIIIRNIMTSNPLTRVSVQEAREAILAQFSPLDPVEVPLPEALGLVPAEDVLSDIDLPPFDNSAMDGYAVRAQDVAG